MTMKPLTSADAQLLRQLPVGTKTAVLHVGDKNELLQRGGALLLLPAGGHSGVQAADLNTSGNDAVKVSPDGHVHS